jgi:hypothetical protein
MSMIRLTVVSGKDGLQTGQHQQQQQRVAGTQEQQAGRAAAEVREATTGHMLKGAVVVIKQDHTMEEDEAAVVGCSRGTPGHSTCSSSSIGRAVVVRGRHVTAGSWVVTSVALTITTMVRGKAAVTAMAGVARGTPEGMEAVQEGVGVGMVGGEYYSRMLPCAMFVVVRVVAATGPDWGATLLGGLMKLIVAV